MTEKAAEDAVFDRQRWADELACRQRELALKEREAATREEELSIKREEHARSKWNPVALAILGATLAGLGNAAALFFNHWNQRDSEERKQTAERKMEKSKAEAARILEMLRVAGNDSVQAQLNLSLLARLGLVSEDAMLAERLEAFVKDRTSPRSTRPASATIPRGAAKRITVRNSVSGAVSVYVDGARIELQGGEETRLAVRPTGSVLGLWSCGWKEQDGALPNGCKTIQVDAFEGERWDVAFGKEKPQAILRQF